MLVTGRTINDAVLKSGCVALVDLAADRIWFFPRGRMPPALIEFLNLGNGRNARLLRDYVVTLGRGII